jgi:hypothetical protein
MGTPQRLRGQEVTVHVVRAGNVENTLTNITDFNFETKLELKEQGYLGETTNRHDEIFNGAKFDMELHLTTGDWLDFQAAIISRATRQEPDLEFNITCTLVYPNGEQRYVTMPDVHFGAQPMKVGGRGDYVSYRIEGAADTFVQYAI